MTTQQRNEPTKKIPSSVQSSRKIRSIVKACFQAILGIALQRLEFLTATKLFTSSATGVLSELLTSSDMELKVWDLGDWFLHEFGFRRDVAAVGRGIAIDVEPFFFKLHETALAAFGTLERHVGA